MCSFFQENYKCAKLKYAKNFAQFFWAKFSFKFSHFSQNCEKLRKRSEFASLRFAENNLTFASLSLRNFFRKKIRFRFAFAIDFLPEFGSLLEAKKSPKQQNNSKKSAPPDKETDVKQLEAANKKLQLEKKELQQALADVLEKHEQIICCRICEEKFDNSEERVPVKLKCSHVFCASCANSWLAEHVIILKLPCLKIFNFLFQGQKATCPQCRTIYRAGDIKPVNFNL